MKRFQCTFLLFLMLAFSCEEVVKIDTGVLEERVIIEGQVINASDLSYVKITRSRDFYAQGPAERVSDALVEVVINSSQTVTFVHNPAGDPLLEGYYIPIGDFIGRVGDVYQLTVNVDEVTYQATEQMKPVTAIDSLTSRFNEGEFEDPEVPGRYFNVLLNAEEPQETEDRYLFKFYRNDTLLRDFPTDVYVAQDELLGDRIAELEIPGFYSVNDLVRVEMYSLTQEAFIFYSDLANLINGDGGMFSPPPANPRNNLDNGALGYFQVSALDMDEVIVYDPREED